MYRIGRYIEYVIETQVPGLCWETAWCRKKEKAAAKLPHFTENIPLITLQLAMVVGAFWLLWLEGRKTWAYLLVGIFGAILAVEGGTVYRANNVEKYEKALKGTRQEHKNRKKENQLRYSETQNPV